MTDEHSIKPDSARVFSFDNGKLKKLLSFEDHQNFSLLRCAVHFARIKAISSVGRNFALAYCSQSCSILQRLSNLS